MKKMEKKREGFYREIDLEHNLLLNTKSKVRGITLIALVITIALNCYRSGRRKECVV